MPPFLHKCQTDGEIGGNKKRSILPNLNCGFRHEVVRRRSGEEAYAYQDRSTAQEPFSVPGERRSRLYES